MREHSIIFNTESVKAILEDRKSQTRRVIKPQPISKISEWNMLPKKKRQPAVYWKDMYYGGYPNLIKDCPYGKLGDRLWVKETWAVISYPDGTTARKFETVYKANDNSGYPYQIKWKPPRFMFKKYARIWLEITDIRVEMLQEINESDSVNEGVVRPKKDGTKYLNSRLAFKDLWNSIHKKEHTWRDNPFVWVISFKKVNQQKGV